MKILIVGLVKNNQLKRVKEEGEKRGHIVEGCYARDLSILCNESEFKPILRGKEINEYDLIYLWAVGKTRWEWYSTVRYLNEKYGTKIVNGKIIDPSYLYYLTSAVDYLKQIEEDIRFPKSAILFSSKRIDDVINNFDFPLILKMSGGRQGKNVFLLNSQEELVKKIQDLKEEKNAFVIREFIPNDGDIRIFTVGYKAIGAMKRIPTKKGEFRSNISQGGRGERFDLKKYPEIKEIAEKMSKITRTEIAGVDIMIHKKTGEPYVLEINPGSQFTGLERYTGVNAALEIIKYFEKVL